MEKCGSLSLNENSTIMSGDSWKETLFGASNMVTDRASRIANLNKAKPSCLPALVTCHNPMPSHPFTGGDFMLSECGLRLEHGLGDVILVNGAREHGVLPVTSNGKAASAIQWSIPLGMGPKVIIFASAVVQILKIKLESHCVYCVCMHCVYCICICTESMPCVLGTIAFQKHSSSDVPALHPENGRKKRSLFFILFCYPCFNPIWTLLHPIV
jgi:hypothetical protein